MRQLKDAILSLYFILRLPVIYAAALLFPVKRYVDEGKPTKILIIRLDRLGDFIMTLPVIENLRFYYPGAKISVLVRPYLADLTRLVRSIDDVIVYDNFFSAARKLREEWFSIAIDMIYDYTLKPALLAFISGAPVRVGFDIGLRGFLFSNVVKPVKEPRPMKDINLDIVKMLGIPVKVTVPRIVLEDAQKKETTTVVIHPGGYYPSQRWPAERFSDVAGKIVRAYNLKLLIAGGPDDRALVEDIVGRLPGDKAETIFTGLKEFSSILAQSSLLICNNSGPLHLAAALGIPTLSIMGPTDPALWWPQGENHVVIRKEGRSGMELVTADEVFEKAKRILDKIDGIKRR